MEYTLNSGTVILIDDEFEWLIKSRNWYMQRSRKYKDEIYKYLASGRYPTVLFHRVVMGATRGQIVDHINGNRLDNRTCNLRICTHAENIRNRKISISNKSGFKGVYALKDCKKFRAEIKKDGIKYYLGNFDTAKEAHEAYKVASNKMHGEFGRHE